MKSTGNSSSLKDNATKSRDKKNSSRSKPMRHIDEIIIHCTATRKSWYEDRPVEDAVKELTRWHVEDNSWSDCGYHFAVNRKGEVGSARPVERSGAHCRSRNKSSIGITLLGGRGGQADDQFLENYTYEQDIALRDLIADLKEAHPKISKISGHNEWSNKACPCFDVEDWLMGD
jgi:N-acetylmuramoyl-L-alanine amidase